jgi:hypothetical protein
VWIGAPVPDPIENGRRIMGLDSERGQEALFLVNPGGGGHLSIYDGAKNEAQLGVLDGRPVLKLQEKGQPLNPLNPLNPSPVDAPMTRD